MIVDHLFYANQTLRLRLCTEGGFWKMLDLLEDLSNWLWVLEKSFEGLFMLEITVILGLDCELERIRLFPLFK